jgi:hypothetical protein
VIHVYTVTTLINNLISLSFGSQLRNGCKYKIQYYLKKEEAPIEYPAIRVTSFVSIVVYLTFLDEFFLTSVQVWEKKIRFKKSDKIVDTATLNFVTSTARVIFNKGNFCFSYDLKSVYHHIEIFDTDRTYLGFQWENKYYVFNVLPFGLATSGYIFSKVVMRERVTHLYFLLLNF